MCARRARAWRCLPDMASLAMFAICSRSMARSWSRSGLLIILVDCPYRLIDYRPPPVDRAGPDSQHEPYCDAGPHVSHGHCGQKWQGSTTTCTSEDITMQTIACATQMETVEQTQGRPERRTSHTGARAGIGARPRSARLWLLVASAFMAVGCDSDGNDEPGQIFEFAFGPDLTLSAESVIPECEDALIGPRGEFRTNIYAQAGGGVPVPLLLRPRVGTFPADTFLLASGEQMVFPLNETVQAQVGSDLCVFSQATEEADEFPDFNEILTEDTVCFTVTTTSTAFTYDLQMNLGTCNLKVNVSTLIVDPLVLRDAHPTRHPSDACRAWPCGGA